MCWQAARTLASDITERGARLYDLLAQETKLQQARAKALRFLDSISGNLQSSSAENEYIERCGEMRREAGREKEGLGGGGEGGRGDGRGQGRNRQRGMHAGLTRVCPACRSIRELITNAQMTLENLKKQSAELEADERALESKVRQPPRRPRVRP